MERQRSQEKLAQLLNIRRCQTGQRAAATQRKIDALYADILEQDKGTVAESSCSADER